MRIRAGILFFLALGTSLSGASPSFTIHLTSYRYINGREVRFEEHYASVRGDSHARKTLTYSDKDGSLLYSERVVDIGNTILTISDTTRLQSTTLAWAVASSFGRTADNHCLSPERDASVNYLGEERIQGLQTFKLESFSNDGRQILRLIVWRAPSLDCSPVGLTWSSAEGRLYLRHTLADFRMESDDSMFAEPVGYTEVKPSDLQIGRAKIFTRSNVDSEAIRRSNAASDQRWVGPR